MKPRVLTALVLIPPVIYLIAWSPLWLFLLALVLVTERTLYEYFVLIRQAGFKPFPVAGYAAGGILCLAQVPDLRQPGILVLAVLILAVLLTLSQALFGKVDLQQYLGSASSTLFGVLYVGFTFSCLVPLRFSERLFLSAAPASGRQLLMFLFLVIWAGDILAYLGGRAFGRTLLFPSVSPKKTVEGAVAGFLGSLLVGWAFARWFWQSAGAKPVILVAGFIALAGQVGDLAESALKRGAQVKDSGTILPGHGGLLDRVDSLLFGAPALWLVLTLKGLFRS